MLLSNNITALVKAPQLKPVMVMGILKGDVLNSAVMADKKGLAIGLNRCLEAWKKNQ